MLYKILFEVFLVSILPISLIKLNLIAKKFRLILLFLVFSCVILIIRFQNIPLKVLGLRIDNISESFFIYLISTTIAIIFLFSLSRIFKNKKAINWYQDPHFLFLFLPISFAQQFLFQGFLFSQLSLIFGTILVVIINALIFGYMHTIYPRPLFSFYLGTLSGVFFGILNTFYPNILLLTITHAILNIAAVYFGFFTQTDINGLPQKTKLKLS